jgi:hypothetical protein
MRKVLDSNFFANPLLEAYLQASKGNFAVLCEFSGIESYKSNDPVKGIANSLSILKKFPKQVIVLKGVRVITSQKIAKSGYLDRMTHHQQTRDFSVFCQYVDKAKNGSKVHIDEILKLASGAIGEADKARDGAQGHIEAAGRVIQEFSKSELKQLRYSSDLPDALFEKILKHLLEMTIYSHHDLGVDIRNANLSDVTNTVVFRSLLCTYLMTLRWYANGSTPHNLEKVRNSVYDCGFAAYATLFDGLLSADEGAKQTYSSAKMFLARLG